MTNIERYDKLGFLLFRMECGIGLPDVIYECMRCGQYDTDMFAPAIFAVCEYFSSLSQTLKQVKEDALAAQAMQVEPDEDPVHQHER